MDKLGAVILAGGKSRRMGKNKAFLTLDGKTFLAKISEELIGIDEIMLSIDDVEKFASEDIKLVEDMYPNLGPVGGIYSALRGCRSEYLLVVSCDMPLFKKELWQYMITFVDSSYDAFALVTRDKRVQPLCSIYSVNAMHILEKQIRHGQYCLHAALDKMLVRYIPLQYSNFHDDIVKNVNTPDEYASLSMFVVTKGMI